MSTLCSIAGCGRQVHARGWCNKHHLKWLRHGEPTAMKRAADGDGCVRPDGYRTVRGRLEHVLTAERALGKPLPAGAEVHHVNEVRSDNQPSNLVICQDRAYHKLLHLRTAALNACGNPNFRRCRICKAWGDPSLMATTRGVEAWWHRACAREYQKRMGYTKRKRKQWST